MTNQQGIVGTAHIRPIYGERWELIIFGVSAAVPAAERLHVLHSIPPFLRGKVAALAIASDGVTQGLGYRSLHPSLGGEYMYSVSLTQAEADELLQYLSGDNT
jgi:hypothetical protein